MKNTDTSLNSNDGFTKTDFPSAFAQVKRLAWLA